MIVERAVLRLTVFRNDADGALDLDAVWKNLQDALYQFEGVELVEPIERETMSDDNEAKGS